MTETKTLNATERRFGFSEEIVEELTHGDCWHLASALRSRLKLPYAIIHGDGQMHHAGIELPDGNIVDIDGVWEVSEWERHWIDELGDVWEVYVGEPDVEDENYELLYPQDDGIENVVYGKDGTTLKEIADSILVELMTKTQ